MTKEQMEKMRRHALSMASLLQDALDDCTITDAEVADDVWAEFDAMRTIMRDAGLVT